MPSAEAVQQDDELLRELGYEQKMTRGWTWVQNFGVSFSIISVVTGITTLFPTGLLIGGPGVMSVGWIVVCFFTMFVALAMAQIVSAIPSAGGPYFWAYALAPKKHAAFASWTTGWFNFLGQVGVTTGITYGCAGLIIQVARVSNPDFAGTAPQQLGIHAALLASHVAVNVLGVKVLAYLNNLSIFLHSVGVAAIAIVLLAKAPELKSGREVFATFYDGTGDPGWSIRASPAYVAVIGLLISQYTITGFDASAHLAEETADASRAAPIGVIMSVGVSAIFGFFLMVSYLFTIQGDFQNVVDNGVIQIFSDVCGPRGAQAMMSVVIVCVWHCGLFSITSNSRMMYAFSRDRALPAFFDHIHPRFKAPVRTICLAAILAFLLAIPAVGSTVAFAAATSIATSGLYISYALPILVGLIYEKDFKKGPFNLRGASRPIALIACLWVAFITVVFCLPTGNPVDSQNLNYTPVCVGTVAAWCVLSWVLWARKWYTGPHNQVEAELAQIPSAGGNIQVLKEAHEKY